MFSTLYKRVSGGPCGNKPEPDQNGKISKNQNVNIGKPKKKNIGESLDCHCCLTRMFGKKNIYVCYICVSSIECVH